MAVDVGDDSELGSDLDPEADAGLRQLVGVDKQGDGVWFKVSGTDRLLDLAVRCDVSQKRLCRTALERLVGIAGVNVRHGEATLGWGDGEEYSEEEESGRVDY